VLKKKRQRWAFGGSAPDSDTDNLDYQIEYIPERFQARRTAYKTHVTCPDRDNWFIAVTKVFEACEVLHGKDCQGCEYIEKCVGLHNSLSERSRDRLIRDDEATKFVIKFLKMRLNIQG
jgi:folate-dependent tRNA-U54 methylase TrmFO/GidA